MFIAMNRFQVNLGREKDFENVWLGRDTHLEKVPGFINFHLLRGPEKDGYRLYASHSLWASKDAFEGWTKSEAFRLAHKDAGNARDIYAGHPNFEGFEILQEVVGAAG